MLLRRMKERKGFGIVEVLVSAAVLGFLYLAVLNLQLSNRQTLLRIRGRDGAVEVAQQVLDSLQSIGATGVKSCSNPKSDTTYDGLSYVRKWSRSSSPGDSIAVTYSTRLTVKSSSEYQSEDASLFSSVNHVYAKNVSVQVSWPFKNTIQSISISGVVR